MVLVETKTIYPVSNFSNVYIGYNNDSITYMFLFFSEMFDQ